MLRSRSVLRHHLVERQQQRRHEADAVTSCRQYSMPGQRRPVAAHLGAHARQPDRDALARKALIQPAGERKDDAGAVLDHVFRCAARSRLAVHPVVHAQGDVGGDAQRVHGLQHEERHGAGQVAAIGRLPADLRIVRVVEEQAGDVPDHRFVVSTPAATSALIVGAQQLVDLAQRAAQRPHAVHDWNQARNWHASRSVRGGLSISHSFMSAMSSRFWRVSGVLLFGSPSRAPGRRASDPFLDAQHQLLFAVVEGGVVGVVQLAVAAHLGQQAAPAQVQPDLHVGPKVVGCRRCPARRCTCGTTRPFQ